MQKRRQCVDGGDVQEETTLISMYEDDNLIFIGGQVVVVVGLCMWMGVQIITYLEGACSDPGFG